MGCLCSALSFRMRCSTSSCCGISPWAMFSRKTSTPASISAASCASSRQAGPTVAMIFVLARTPGSRYVHGASWLEYGTQATRSGESRSLTGTPHGEYTLSNEGSFVRALLTPAARRENRAPHFHYNSLACPIRKIISPPKRTSKRWPWAAAFALVFIGLAFWGLKTLLPGLPEIQPADLAAAEVVWSKAQPADYDLTVQLSGRQTGELKVSVRNGAADGNDAKRNADASAANVGALDRAGNV